MDNDALTAAFQVAACLFIADSIRSAWRDRELKGVSVRTIGFFTVWTIWGAVNWHLLRQPWSFWTSVLMFGLYVVWLALVVPRARAVAAAAAALVGLAGCELSASVAVSSAPAASATAPEPNVVCTGRFEELGPYQGVRITCDDGRRYLYQPNKYIYTRRPL